MKHTYHLEFRGFCNVDAESMEEAIQTLRQLNPHDGRVYDDEITITKAEYMDDDDYYE